MYEKYTEINFLSPDIKTKIIEQDKERERATKNKRERERRQRERIAKLKIMNE